MIRTLRTTTGMAGLALLAACAGRPAPVTTPTTRATAAAPAADAPSLISDGRAPRARPQDPVRLPPPPLTDAAELAALLRESAETAADSALMETIANGTAGATSASGKSDPLGNPLRSSDVSWDIDVASYEDHGRVRYWVEFFSGRARNRFGIWLERMARYEPMIRARLAQQKLPGDLIYLALIESGFSNSAISSASAVGMWQFMRPTARGVGLRVDRWMDERRDPVRATDAAAKHLDMLRRQFGSLYLAAAAYNAGGGKVSRSLAKMERIRPAQGDAALEEVPEDDGSDGWSDDDFFRLHDTNLLKQETRDYVPKLIAAAIIAKEPARFGFTDLQPAPPFEADSIVVESMTGLDVVARLAGTSVATIRDLNPQYLRWATPPGRSSVVRVPKGTGSSAARAYDALPQSEHVTFATHVARKNETMTRVAKRYGVSLAALKEANPDVGRLRSGTRLLVPRGGGVSTAAARSIRAAEAAEYHKVRRGETATRIARRYGVTVAELKAWNRGKVAKNGRVTNGVRLLVSEPEGRSVAARTATGGAGKGKSASAKVKASRNVARAEGGSPASATTSTKANATSAARVRSHTVRRGDTLTGVAQRYGTSVAALRKANKLRGGDIRAGQRLKIPA